MGQGLIQLDAHVWYWPHHPDPNIVQPSIGMIVGQSKSILVDAGNGPAHAIQVRAALDQAGLPPVSMIIYTHHHWDHVFGACVYDVPVIAHTKCRNFLLEEAQKPWSKEYLDKLVQQNPKLRASCKARNRAISDWQNFRIVIPNIVFERSKVIELDGLKIELEHVGGQHAEDSIIVKVSRSRVMFIGDCYYPPPLHLRTPGSTISKEILSNLVDEKIDYYVEGHDDPTTRDELDDYLSSVDN